MLLRQPTLSGLSRCLASAGHWEAAARLEISGLLAWAEEVCSLGRCLTVVEESYPRALVERLGDLAPPALWIAGEFPPGEVLAVAGSRSAPEAALQFAEAVGRFAASSGRQVATGGAVGCDAATERGATDRGGSVIRFVPFGLGNFEPRDGVCVLSAVSPEARFTTAAAMERNQLVFSCAARGLVAHAHHGHGGSWHGAKEVLRRRRVPLYLRECGAEWHSALTKMGATSVADPEQFVNDVFNTRRRNGGLLAEAAAPLDFRVARAAIRSP